MPNTTIDSSVRRSAQGERRGKVRSGHSRSDTEKKESNLYYARKKPELNPLHWELRNQIKDVIYALRELLDYIRKKKISLENPAWLR